MEGNNIFNGDELGYAFPEELRDLYKDLYYTLAKFYLLQIRIHEGYEPSNYVIGCKLMVDELLKKFRNDVCRGNLFDSLDEIDIIKESIIKQYSYIIEKYKFIIKGLESVAINL